MMELILARRSSGVGGVTAIGAESAARWGAGFMGQVMAVGDVDGRRRRVAAPEGRSTVPTLVMHGGDDLLLPRRQRRSHRAATSRARGHAVLGRTPATR